MGAMSRLRRWVVAGHAIFNPRDPPNEEIKRLQSGLTVVDGKVVYDDMR
jgi:predicted amidohydrolase YtcJ